MSEVFWNTTASPGSPQYVRLLLESLNYCDNMGDVGDVVNKLAKDFNIEYEWKDNWS